MHYTYVALNFTLEGLGPPAIAPCRPSRESSASRWLAFPCPPRFHFAQPLVVSLQVTTPLRTAPHRTHRLCTRLHSFPALFHATPQNGNTMAAPQSKTTYLTVQGTAKDSSKLKLYSKDEVAKVRPHATILTTGLARSHRNRTGRLTARLLCENSTTRKAMCGSSLTMPFM